MRAALLRLDDRAAVRRRSARQRAAVALLTSLVSFIVAAPPSMSASNPVLYVTFSASGSASVTLSNGTPVGSTSGAPTVIPAGYYAISVSGPPAFVTQIDFDGPGVNLAGSLDDCGVGSIYEAYFAPNSTYTWRDPNGEVGTFVTSGVVEGSPPPSTGSSDSSTSASGSSQDLNNQIVGSAAPAVRFRGILHGSVSRSGSLSLTFEGKPAARLLAGDYRFVIANASRTAGFVFQERLQPPMTLAAPGSVGKHSLSVDLTAGDWFFMPHAFGKAVGSVVVVSSTASSR